MHTCRREGWQQEGGEAGGGDQCKGAAAGQHGGMHGAAASTDKQLKMQTGVIPEPQQRDVG